MVPIPLGTLSDTKYALFYVPSFCYGYLYTTPTEALNQISISAWIVSFSPFTDFTFLLLSIICLLGAMLWHGGFRIIFGPESYSKDSETALKHFYALILNVEIDSLPDLPSDYREMLFTEEGVEKMEEFVGYLMARPKRALFGFSIIGVTYISSWASFVPLYILFTSSDGNHIGGILILGLSLLLVRPIVWDFYPTSYITPQAASRLYTPEYEYSLKEGLKEKENRQRIDPNRPKGGGLQENRRN